MENELQPQEAPKTYSQEEFEKTLQSETDRRVSQALQTARQKWEAEVSSKIDSSLKDYEKRAALSPEQLKQMDLEEKFKMLDSREKEFIRKSRELDISKRLSEVGMSTLFLPFVYADEDEAVDQKLHTINELVMGMVNQEIEKRIQTSKPKQASSNEGLTREEFAKLNLAERQKLFRTNPKLYMELTK